jgi:hypothetical protein
MAMSASLVAALAQIHLQNLQTRGPEGQQIRRAQCIVERSGQWHLGEAPLLGEAGSERRVLAVQSGEDARHRLHTEVVGVIQHLDTVDER